MSGGQAAMIKVQREAFDASALLRDFTDGCSKSGHEDGAIVSFTGLVRDQTKQKKEGLVLRQAQDEAGPSTGPSGSVTTLELDHYPQFTEKMIAGFEQEARRLWPINHVLIVHRYGRMAPGEAIVFVATASAHRKGAFEAASYLMDRLKTDAPFWKKEKTATGEAWIEPTEKDYAAREEWCGGKK
jgi:molybdopterin synthase catalytic subunit